jgi:hypothetical protein
MTKQFIIAGLFFAFILLSGVWLSRTGRPLNVLILTIHKLISLAGVVYLGISVYRIHQTAGFSPLEISAVVVTLLLFIGLFASGGILSAAKTVPALVLKIHQVMPYLVILSTSASLYLLLVQSSQP